RWSRTQSEDAAGTLRMITELRWFWTVRGYLGEGRRWFEEALLAASGAPPAVCARAHGEAGLLAFFQEDYAAAAAYLAAALDLFRRLDDRKGIARTLDRLAQVFRCRGEDLRAAELHAESLSISTALGDRQAMALSHYHLGAVAYGRGELDAARCH